MIEATELERGDSTVLVDATTANPTNLHVTLEHDGSWSVRIVTEDPDS